jgi:uncharacterized heparinase superfamily protein
LVLAAAAGFPEGERLAEQGEEMLIEACAKQFFLDGGHLSRAPEACAEALCDLLTARQHLADPPPILDETLPKLANMVRMLRLGDGGLACFHGGSEGSALSIEAALARVSGGERYFQFAQHSAYQRLEAGGLRVLMDVGAAPPLAYSERAHASALAFELSSGTERLIVNVGAAILARTTQRNQRVKRKHGLGSRVPLSEEDLDRIGRSIPPGRAHHRDRDEPKADERRKLRDRRQRDLGYGDRPRIGIEHARAIR